MLKKGFLPFFNSARREVNSRRPPNINNLALLMFVQAVHGLP